MKQHVKLTKKEEIANGTMAFHFKKPAELTFRAGQFCDITLINPTDRMEILRSIKIKPPKPYF